MQTYKAILLSTAVAAMSTLAHAQDKGSGSSAPANGAKPTEAAASLDEIVVTATRHQEFASKVPISVAAFSEQKLDDLGIKQIADLAQVTPGLRFSASSAFSSSSTSISIRGISSGAGASTTGIYIDDTPIQARSLGNSASTTFPEVFDLQRIEVLKGPQGTLFGAGAEGGAVRFITPGPNLEKPTGYVRSEVSYTQAGDPSYEAGAAYGAPIVEDKLGFRVSAWYRRDGGWIDRLSETSAGVGGVSAKNSNYQDSYVAKGALAFKPTTNITVTPSIYFQQLYTNDTSSLFKALTNLHEDQFNNGYVIGQPVRDKFILPALLVNADIGIASFTSNTSLFYRDQTQTRDYTNFDQEEVTRGQPFATLPGQNAPTNMSNKQKNFTQEFRLQSLNNDSRFTWVVGAFYANQLQSYYQLDHDSYLNQVTINGTNGKYNLRSYFGYPYVDGDLVFNGSGETRTEQVAGFANLDYKITDKLKLTAGVRVASVRVKFNQQDVGAYWGPFSTAAGEQHETPVTPKFVVSYQLDEHNLLYADAAKGYREGGAQVPAPTTVCATDLASIGLTSTPSSYNSDSTMSYEIGSKNQLLNDRITIDASAYHVTWNNIQRSIYLPTCGATFTGNFGSATSNGFELALQARPLRPLTLGLVFGYNDMRADASIVVGKSEIIVSKGDRLGGAPYSGDFSGQYDFVFRELPSFVRFDFDFTAGGNKANPLAYGYDPNEPPNPPINQLNLRAGVKLSGWEVSAFSNNTTDAHPSLGQYHLFKTSPLYTITTLRPLQVGLTLAKQF